MKRLAAVILLLPLLIALLPAAAQDSPALTLQDSLAFAHILSREIILSPDGGALALASTEDYSAYTLLLIDVATPENRYSIPFDAYIDDLAFSPDGTRLAVATADGIFVGDVLAGTVTHDFAFNSRSRMTNVVFAPDGDSVAFSVSDGDTVGKVFWWNFITGEARTLLERDPRGYVVYVPVDLALSPDGVTLVASTRFTSYALDLAGEHPVRTFGNFHSGGDLAFNADGSRLGVGSLVSAGFMLLDTASWETVASAPYLGSGGPAFSPDGGRLALVSYDGQQREVQLWDAVSGEALRTLADPHATCAAFSPDGAWLATGGDDGLLHLWDAASGAPLIETQVGEDGLSALAFSPDGTRLFTLAGDVVSVWTIE